MHVVSQAIDGIPFSKIAENLKWDILNKARIKLTKISTIQKDTSSIDEMMERYSMESTAIKVIIMYTKLQGL